MPLTDFCTSARQSPVVVWVVRLAMGKFLRSHAACEANRATRKRSLPSRMEERSLVIGASADYAHKNGRNHFAQILYFSIFGHIFWCNFSKTTHFWNHLAPVVGSPATPTPIRKTVLSNKYNAICLVSLNFEQFLSLLHWNLSRSGICSFYFLLLKKYTAGC